MYFFFLLKRGRLLFLVCESLPISFKYLSPEEKMMHQTLASGSNLDYFAEHPLSCTLESCSLPLVVLIY